MPTSIADVQSNINISCILQREGEMLATAADGQAAITEAAAAVLALLKVLSAVTS